MPETLPKTLNVRDVPVEPEDADERLEQCAPQPPSTGAWPYIVGVSRGQTLVEYALIILFVVLAVVLSLALIAPALNNIFNQVPNAL